jgi:hypothetical protein
MSLLPLAKGFIAKSTPADARRAGMVLGVLCKRHEVGQAAHAGAEWRPWLEGVRVALQKRDVSIRADVLPPMPGAKPATPGGRRPASRTASAKKAAPVATRGLPDSQVDDDDDEDRAVSDSFASLRRGPDLFATDSEDAEAEEEEEDSRKRRR